MVLATRYKPICIVSFSTEIGPITLKAYGSSDYNAGTDIDKSVIGVQTMNDIGQDAGTFTITLAYRKEWEKFIASNDKVVIQMQRKTQSTDPTVFFGLVDDVRKGVVLNGNVVQRTVVVSGRSVAKALINFEIGVIPETDAMTTNLGWLMSALPNDSFMGQSAAQITKSVINDLVFKYMNYTFKDGSTLKDLIQLQVSSRPNEQLQDDGSFLNYQGSVFSFLREVSNEPFNQIFTEVYDGKPTFVLRETPYNPDKWNSLSRYLITDEDVQVETLGRSDVEAYTMFSVGIQSFFSQADPSGTLGNPPLWNSEYFKKYGVRRIQRYTSYIGFASSSDNVNAPLQQAYQNDLYNWYILNPTFFNGYITVMGQNDFKIGDRLIYESAEHGTVYEFFIESVAHDFVNFQYWTTTLGVSRGLPDSGASRFESPWGKSEPYTGGALGVPTSASQSAGSSQYGQIYINPGETATGTAANIIQTAQSYVGNVTYIYGRGRNSVDASQNIFDCSSFVWWVYHTNGIDLGDQSSVTTYNLAALGVPETLNTIEPGDLIMFNTDGRDGHVGIYIGNGQFISAENENTGCRVGDVKTWAGLYGVGDIRRIIT